ncbi:NAD-dependent epimerase/dehydratase family protein [Subsaximicrobium wynnwilliamsii]|uniref:NAD-dependent epimerase/dehydratase family protein n=1 Tax=Subsaximicrobium wynnwilliamsii TaxID=291179 RepID=A0A5C6ZGL2_9FLAO|nr:NAD-dependent epimerase/dehydratase family protein [Subsaximicrobium wynnwilliamsii]TXD81354.1 NAD-dependent epimerase/dehydratase family protein [Subsaximicrobium wynnwilliamsii]TXD89050.1 NAD-dependent epimerase/dehydratase family protein [Subsaximicrobium wynnwilliamsii]TXE00728.1 NAD-dependent epimerase/dehydratase family protein [Subsaximicrobium wynnwilliamsii]
MSSVNKDLPKTILVTGAAGFIGFHLCKALLERGHNVLGLDNINDYYDINLKYSRLEELGIDRLKAENFSEYTTSTIYGTQMTFVRMNLEDRMELPKIFKDFKISQVCNLAAQAGVRYSLENPEAYIDSNIVGFLNVLECCRNFKIKKLVYASSSSVYGNSEEVPFKETANVDHPISLYAATKKSNELMAHTYSHLYGFETIGLRFFTVYGPWGRPDMAMFLFTDAIMHDKPIKVFNNGELSRDFTFIDDIIAGVLATLLNSGKDQTKPMSKLYNIGNSQPVKLLDYVAAIENELNKKANKAMMPMQAGDVNQTFANIDALKADYKYQPKTSIKEGIASFVDWYNSYYNKD